MKLRYISTVKARNGVDIRTAAEGITLAPGPGGKKAVFDFDWRQDRPQDFIKLLPRDVHSVQAGEFTIYYGYGFVPEGESQDVQQVVGQKEQLRQQKTAAPRQGGVSALMQLPDDVLADEGHEPDDDTPQQGFGPVIRAHNAGLARLLKGPLKGWAAANPEAAANLQVGVNSRPRSPAEYHADATRRAQEAFGSAETYQDLGGRGRELQQQQTKVAAAYKKAASVLANMIQDKGETSPDVARLLDLAVENLIKTTGGDYDSIVLPQSSNPTALMIARRVAGHTGATVGQPFRKPTESGPAGLHFDAVAYQRATGKTADENTNMGGRFPLPLSKVLSNPGKFKMTSIRRDMRPYWRNTQMADERWLSAHCTGKVLVVDDSLMSGSTMVGLLEQVGSYAEVAEGYALLKIGT